eukprot:1137363-Pelagomonas_calceolata.AAC.5
MQHCPQGSDWGSVSVVKRSAKVYMDPSLLPWTHAIEKKKENTTPSLNLVRLQEQGIAAPEKIRKDIPDWAFPNGTGPSDQNQSRPDAVFVHPIQGRATHLDPKMIPAHDKDIHLVESKYCPDTNSLPAYKELLPSMLTATNMIYHLLFPVKVLGVEHSLARSVYQSQRLRSAALVGGYSDATLPLPLVAT